MACVTIYPKTDIVTRVPDVPDRIHWFRDRGWVKNLDKEKYLIWEKPKRPV